jgi:amino acid permease
MAPFRGLPSSHHLWWWLLTNQTNHRTELENLVIREDNKRANKAQLNSFIITIAILILSAILFIMGKDGVAIAAVFTAIAPIIIAFITSSISRQKERENKRKELGG